MSDIVSGTHPDDCGCYECAISKPHPYAQELTKRSYKNQDFDVETASFRIGDPSVEDGSDSIYVGGFKKGKPHGNGILVTVCARWGDFDSRDIDSQLRKLGRSWTMSDLYDYFSSAGIVLHESEFPFLTLEGRWNEGILVEGNSFFFDSETTKIHMGYSGTWHKNMPHGVGKIDFGLGYYWGDIRFGKRDGGGLMVRHDGRMIVGSWSENYFHGHMQFIHENAGLDVDSVRGVLLEQEVKKQKRDIRPIIENGSIGEQEFFMGRESSPRSNTSFEEGEKLLSSITVDVNGSSVARHVAWQGDIETESYTMVLDGEDIQNIDESDVIDGILHMPHHRTEENWIYDDSEFIIRGSSGSVLGWMKKESSINNMRDKATIVFPDLSYYKGEVEKEHFPNGVGSYRFPGGYLTISGVWKDGEIVDGSIFFHNQRVFKGSFERGQPSIEGGVYYRNQQKREKGFSKKNQRAHSKKEKEMIRRMIWSMAGHDLWSKENNFTDWNLKILHHMQLIKPYLEIDSIKPELNQLITSDESHILEFKSSVWATYNNSTGELIDDVQKNLKTEDSIVKTIAGFCNSDGGTLVIGVQDRPERRIVGIDADLQYSGRQKDIESFQNSLSQVIREATNENGIVGSDVKIRIEEYDGKRICIVNVNPRKWVWVSLKKFLAGEPQDNLFFIRTGPQTVSLNARSAHDYRINK